MGDKMPTWYGRDAANVRNSQAVVLIGAEKKPRGVPHCGYCGFGNCAGCKTAAEMDYAPNCMWLGIPISVSGKNIFFDRGIFHD